MSVKKIKSLGWAARYSNAEALVRSYKWYRENKHALGSAGVTHRTAWKQGILGLLKKIL